MCIETILYIAVGVRNNPMRSVLASDKALLSKHLLDTIEDVHCAPQKYQNSEKV